MGGGGVKIGFVTDLLYGRFRVPPLVDSTGKQVPRTRNKIYVKSKLTTLKEPRFPKVVTMMSLVVL